MFNTPTPPFQAFLPLLRKAAKTGSGMGCHRAAVVNMSSDSASMQLVDAKKLYLQVYPYRIAKVGVPNRSWAGGGNDPREEKGIPLNTWKTLIVMSELT